MGITGSDLALLPARSGLERAGASRANYFAKATIGGVSTWTFNVVTVIDGVDVSEYVTRAPNPEMAIGQVLNDEPDTATFSLLPAAGFVVVTGQLVSIGFGDASNVEFAGQVLRATRRYVRGISAPFQDVECVDYSRLLDRRLVTTHYGSQSATDIATDLIATYTSGFTSTSVASGLPTVDDFPITNETVSSALKRLATLIDGAFYIDARRDLHFFGIAGDVSAKGGTAPAALTIVPNLPSLKAFSFLDDISQLRTRVIVDGMSTSCPIGTPAPVGSVVVDASTPVDYLIVAGGGGGGASTLGAGAGAGGMSTGTDTLASGSFGVTVGGGGAAGSNGSDSSFNGHTATGGGHGGTSGVGTSGGSGGGGGQGTAGGAGTAGQGNNGGAGNFALSAAGGGGGGAGAAGVAAGPNIGGAGGAGLGSSISGSPVTYAGGGGGNGASQFGAAGSGGGGKGGAGGNPSTAGTANTGGGGGNNAAGGSGVVILSYPTGAISATGGTITTVGGRTIHTFTSSGTFTVSTVTLFAAPATVTDIPLADPSKLDPTGGTVVIGTDVFPYVSVSGQIPAAGVNAPGTTLTAAAAIGDTSVSIASAIYFATVPGWAKIGDQYVRFTGQTAGSLTGIPSLGFGAITAAVSSGTTVTSLGWLVLSTGDGVTFSPALSAGDTITQRVTVDDLGAQATVAAIEGEDGIHEYYLQDGSLSVAGATARANAELADFHANLETATWETEDLNARPSRMQAIAIDTITPTLLITRADVSFPAPNGLPRRKCEASTVRVAALLDAIVTTT